MDTSNIRYTSILPVSGWKFLAGSSLWRNVSFACVHYGGSKLRVRCNSSLDAESTGGDPVLSETELLQSCASGDLNLGGHDIDTGDLLGNGVLCHADISRAQARPVVSMC